MEKQAIEELKKYQWKPCPEGQKIIDTLIERFLRKCSRTRELVAAMKARTGTRFLDWIDYIVTPDTSLVEELEAAGFGRDELEDGELVFEHRGAIFPRVLVSEAAERVIALKVESVADFLAAHNLQSEIQGMPFGQMRAARAWCGNYTELWVVERHGFSGFVVPQTDPEQAIMSQEHLESFRARRREYGSDGEAFAAIHGMIDTTMTELGRDWTADLWFAAERDYWMRRNRAARVQKARQDTLGLGWANHDHHTYRCRRTTFADVISVFEKLGCRCRERFYAGAEAGWGAQVLEHATTGIVIFADVDMQADEIAGDFSHKGFKPREELGTVGLWCELHGESILKAGMHHLECQFDFESLAQQMKAEAGIGMMEPFTNFDFLKQQFTEGERWEIDPDRIDRVLESGQITKAQAEKFRAAGAIGSHLENLQRNDGFKGFNQTGINEIIKKTDPRVQLKLA